MNITWNSQISYRNTNSAWGDSAFSGADKSFLWAKPEKTDDGKSSKSQQMRELIRNLKQTQDNANPYAVTSQDRTNGLLDPSGAADKEEEKLQKRTDYSYKEVAAKIQRAKTSAGAGQAVLSAKRKVLEVKRKLASGDGDAEELQIALTHAKRMELVARKKKRHLELEEMVVRTQKNDELQELQSKAQEEITNMASRAGQEKILQKEDRIFKVLSESVLENRENEVSAVAGEDAGSAEISGGAGQGSPDFDELFELGEEALEELEEVMEQFENLEVIDPHMSKAEFEELRTKHRASEDRAIIKADMDYLKDTFTLNNISIDLHI